MKGHLLIAVLLSVIIGSGFATPTQAITPGGLSGSWTVKAGMPTAREGLAAGAVGSTVHAVKGYIPGDSGVTEAYNTVTDSWTGLATSPIPEAELAGTAVGTKVYAIGGRTSGGQTLDVYDTATNTWSLMAPIPTPRRGAAAVAEGTTIYVLGGSACCAPGSFPQFSANEAYDTLTNTWGLLAPMPTPRSDAYAVAVSGKIYVIGGFSSSSINFTSTFLQTVEVYDIAANSWSTLALMPTARSHMVAGVCGENIFVVGGAAPGFTPLGTVEAYSVGTNTWVTGLPSMPTPRWEVAAAQVGNTLYVLGGGGFGAIVRNQDGSGPNEAFTMVCPQPGRARLSVSPTVSTAPRRANFSISITVANVSNLNGFDISLTFDPEVLTASFPVDAGNVVRTFCSQTPGCFVASSEFSAGPGFVRERLILGGSQPGFSGSGFIYVVPFETTRRTGTAVLHIASNSLGEGKGVLLTPTGEGIPHFTVDGVFSNDGPDMFVSIVPNILEQELSSSGNSAVTIYSLNGLTGTVSLTLTGVPSNVDARLDQTSLVLAGASATTKLQVLVGSSATPGNFSLTITGSISTGGQKVLVRSGSLELVISPPRPDFEITLTPQRINIPVGGSGTLDVIITSFHGFSDSVQLGIQLLPADITASFSINPVTPPKDGSSSSKLTLVVSQFSFARTLTLAVVASGPDVTHTSTFILEVSNFEIFALPSFQVLQPGQTVISTIGLFSVNGFSGTIALDTVNVPQGVKADLNPTELSLGTNSSAFSTLTLAAGPEASPGNFMLFVVATSPTSFNVVGIFLAITDFSITPETPQLNIPVTGSTVTRVFLSSVNFFQGTVDLSISGAPPGVSASLRQTSLFVTAGSTISADLAITVDQTAKAADFDLTITGIGGPTKHSAVLKLRITDFSISASPASLSLARRETGTIQVTVFSLNGFVSPVTLTVTGLAAGVTATFTSDTVNPDGGQATTTLTLTVGRKPDLGTFTIVITAASGSLTHSVTISLTITRT